MKFQKKLTKVITDYLEEAKWKFVTISSIEETDFGWICQINLKGDIPSHLTLHKDFSVDMFTIDKVLG